MDVNNVQEAVTKSVDDGVDVDFDEAISSQIAALQGGSSGSAVERRRFQAVDTKTSNCIFIWTTLIHPDELVTKLLSDVVETGRTKARFILKMFPVLGTCRAVEEKIEKLVEELVSTYFADRPLGTFAIIYKVRCNQLSRDVILSTVGRAVYRACPTSKVDLTNPDYVISVDVLNKFACVSIMKDFHRLKKYNLQELAKSESSRTGGTCQQPAVERNEPAENERGLREEQDGKCQRTEPSAADTSYVPASDVTVEKSTEISVDDLQSNTESTGSGDNS